MAPGQGDLPNRPEAIRRLVKLGLNSEGAEMTPATQTVDEAEEQAAEARRKLDEFLAQDERRGRVLTEKQNAARAKTFVQLLNDFSKKALAIGHRAKMHRDSMGWTFQTQRLPRPGTEAW